MEKRFGNATTDEIREKRDNICAKATKKSNAKAARILRDYLKFRGEPENFETFSTNRLDDVLSHFYINVRRADGEKYKASSLENLRFSLNRYLHSALDHKIDLKDEEFRNSNVSFRAALNELKREGYGNTEHHPEISETHLRQIYNSEIMQPDHSPEFLQNKVQFDIRFYFFRRGGENIPQMTKSTFAIGTDSNTGRKYVHKKLDELNKNNRAGNKETSSGVMPEKPGDPMCPVLSFKLYMGKLSDDCDRLWQRPKTSSLISDTTWYTAVPVGEKKLSGFMTRIVKSLNLPVKYTNHSIRATGATLLSRANFNNAQIMSVTGHKSVSSLAVYQRVGSDEKMDMGDALARSLSTKSTALVKAAPSTRRLLPSSTLPQQQHQLQNQQRVIAAGNHVETSLEGIDFEIGPLSLEDFDSFMGRTSSVQQQVTLQQTQGQQQQQIQRSLQELPFFSNCMISNVTINYHQ